MHLSLIGLWQHDIIGSGEVPEMAKDSIFNRFSKNLQKKQLNDLGQRARSTEDIEAEQEILEQAETVEPIKADVTPGRNDPCSCGSGKKYKKCCGAG